MEARPGKDAEAEELLRSALPSVRAEAGTTAWFAVSFGRSKYGVFDVFPDEEGRSAHLSGPVATSLMEGADELFVQAPQIVKLDVLAEKLPSAPTTATPTKGLLLTFKPKPKNEGAVADFLQGARSIVEEEPGTIAWFAIRLENGHYGIFDVFPENRSRIAHLTGHVPRELAKHATSLLGGLPSLKLPNVLAAKLPDDRHAALPT